MGLYVTMIASTIGFGILLTYGNPYVMSLIVDRISAEPVAPDQVFDVFGPYIAALLAINLVGQACSKLQDYSLWKLEIAVSYDLATMAFDALSNQSMTFHSNRFGGTLVSQTTKFMNAYSQLIETLTFPFLPVICSVVATCIILVPRVPLYVGILMVLLVLYGTVSYLMYRRILNLNEKAAGAQNQLSGELADSVANILAVKTYGREDYERGLFDTANREVVARDSKRMMASLARGVITALIAVSIMAIVTVFIAGGNAWFGITPGTLVMMFTYTYTVTNQTQAGSDIHAVFCSKGLEGRQSLIVIHCQHSIKMAVHACAEETVSSIRAETLHSLVAHSIDSRNNGCLFLATQKTSVAIVRIKAKHGYTRCADQEIFL